MSLRTVATSLQAAARARPGEEIVRSLEGGATISLYWFGARFRLKVQRKGLGPGNDFSAVGRVRREAWERELETFRRAFGVSAGGETTQFAYGLFYWAVIQWVPVAPAQEVRDVERS